ncbi:ribosomal biogenesis protein LAS1L [Chiloscyllium plagiosum]|uniref:ribosomal biogenesis protein LAS1L n=1 Tax=Chiloscyllium plagiosum TaxID=36176 RepID=UPI001CB7E83F|nr:ribosomal biogenesis protein LAS1L [Chiloscyllium plagiosum]
MVAGGKRSGQVVAWLNRAEWDQVIEYLYSRDSKLQRYALDRISAWKSRYGSSTPLAVECTEALMQCKLQDEAGETASSELILSYGLALVRFVNLITEKKQKTVAVPLRRLASKMNIPEWIVNLRHELTHRKLPTLAWCRKGCEFVLEWLRQQYWNRQLGNNVVDNWVVDSQEEEEADDEAKIQDEMKQKELYDKARELLTSFEKEQFQVLMEQKLVSKAKRFWSTPTPEIEWILSQVKKHVLDNREVVVDALLDDGFLIPKEEQLKFLNIDCPGEFVDLSNPGIPRTFCRFWQPLLKYLHSQYFTPVLLEKLFTELKLCCDTSGLRIQYVTGWITEILAANAKAGKRLRGLARSQKMRRSMWQLFLFQCPLDWHDLLESCLAAPCQATPHLLQQILTDMDAPLPISTQQKLLQLCSIYIQEPGSFSVSDFPVGHGQLPVYTVENLQMKSGIESPKELADTEFRKNIEPLMIPTSGEEMVQTVNLEILSEKIQALEGSVWQICTDQIAWKDYPLGKIPGQKEDPSCLLVDSYTLMPVLQQSKTEENLDDFNTAFSNTGLPCADSEGLWWTQSDLYRLKAGLKLF